MTKSMPESNRHRLLTTAVSLTALTLALGAAAPAFAQEAQVEAVVITGSRIAQPNLKAVSPLTVVDSSEITTRGTTSVETLLNSLPQFSGGLTENTGAITASGTATANLRGLGPERTLVLIDGRRLMPGDPIVPAPDLNTIPAALVQRVDIVTGGASAVYGSDAVAGVVNFLLKKNFQGLQLSAQASTIQHSQKNGAAQAALRTAGVPIPEDNWTKLSYDMSLIAGSNLADDRGNITAYATYRQQEPLLAMDRDYASCSLNIRSATPFCNNSSNSALGAFQLSTGLVSNNPDGSKTFVPYTNALGFNAAKESLSLRKGRRFTAGFFGNYKINDAIEAYSDFMYMDDRSTGAVGASGVFLDRTYTINCNNPLMSASQASAICPGQAITTGAAGGATKAMSLAYRFDEVGKGRVYAFDHEAFKVDLGVRGEVAPGWKYDAYLQYGTAARNQQTRNYVSTERVQNALNVVLVNGVATCAGTVSGATPGCIPLDVFSARGASTNAAARAYVGGVTAFTTGRTTEKIASASISGDLGQYGVKSPWSEDGVGIALGAEHRSEKLVLTYDDPQKTGRLGGSPGIMYDVNGGFSLSEVYGEVRAPIATDLPFAKLLSIGAGYRYSDYSISGGVSTFKVDGEWAPISDLRVRASFNRAIRAPNVQELFAPRTIGGAGSTDDVCAGPRPTASAAACALTGVTAAQYGTISDCPTRNCGILTGGNLALKPEEADTKSIGVVVSPSFVPRFNFSVDYYDIKVKDYIASGLASPATTLAQCAAGNSFFCALIKRNSNGLLYGDGYIVQTKVNAGFLRTSGIDVNGSYRLPLPEMGDRDWGSLNFNFVGSYLIKNEKNTAPGLGTFDCAGYYGDQCGQVRARWGHQLRTTWTTPWDLSASVNWAYVGRTKLDFLSSDPLLARTGFAAAHGAKVKASSGFDLAVIYDGIKNLSVRASVNNVFDDNQSLADPLRFGLGRTFILGLTGKF